MTELKPCPFLVRMCSMDGQIIGYTCKGECANCPAEDAKDKEIERLKAALTFGETTTKELLCTLFGWQQLLSAVPVFFYQNGVSSISSAPA